MDKLIGEIVPSPIFFIYGYYFKQKQTIMNMKKTILSLLLSTIAFVGFGQITTSSISGVVKNEKNEVLVGATVQAIHTPTGTKYGTSTNKNGGCDLRGRRCWN